MESHWVSAGPWGSNILAESAWNVVILVLLSKFKVMCQKGELVFFLIPSVTLEIPSKRSVESFLCALGISWLCSQYFEAIALNIWVVFFLISLASCEKRFLVDSSSWSLRVEPFPVF